MSKRASWRSFAVVLAVVALSATLLFALVFGSCMWMVGNAFEDVTDVRQYATLRSRLGASAQHFPVSIPPEATGVQLRFSPGFGQGGNELSVRYKLPAPAASALAASMPAGSAFERFSDDFICNHHATLLGEPGKAIPLLKDLTQRYHIFIHHASGNWNHPNVGAVLIDVESGDVLYTAFEG